MASLHAVTTVVRGRVSSMSSLVWPHCLPWPSLGASSLPLQFGWGISRFIQMPICSARCGLCRLTRLLSMEDDMQRLLPSPQPMVACMAALGPAKERKQASPSKVHAAAGAILIRPSTPTRMLLVDADHVCPHPPCKSRVTLRRHY